MCSLQAMNFCGFVHKNQRRKLPVVTICKKRYLYASYSFIFNSFNYYFVIFCVWLFCMRVQLHTTCVCVVHMGAIVRHQLHWNRSKKWF